MKRNDRRKVTRWFAAAVLLLAGFTSVWYWRDLESASLLIVWLPLVYSLATLISKRREIVEQLRASPLWFAVSVPQAYEHGFGYGRTFAFSEELTSIHSKQEYSDRDTYYFEVGSGLSWFSGDEVGQQLDFQLGVRNNVLEMSAGQARQLVRMCRDYNAATSKFHICFTLGWVGAILLLLTTTLQQNAACLFVAVWVMVLWGIAPRRSMEDRTESYEFVCPEHIHVYAYYPGDSRQQPCYVCRCGKVEVANEPETSACE